jgi:hypothetical protein
MHCKKMIAGIGKKYLVTLRNLVIYPARAKTALE